MPGVVFTQTGATIHALLYFDVRVGQPFADAMATCHSCCAGAPRHANVLADLAKLHANLVAHAARDVNSYIVGFGLRVGRLVVRLGACSFVPRPGVLPGCGLACGPG